MKNVFCPAMISSLHNSTHPPEMEIMTPKQWPHTQSSHHVERVCHCTAVFFLYVFYILSDSQSVQLRNAAAMTTTKTHDQTDIWPFFFFFFSFSGIELSHFRIPGVLQRFAGTYLIVATVHLLSARPFDDSRVGRLHGTVGSLLVLLR